MSHVDYGFLLGTSNLLDVRKTGNAGEYPEIVMSLADVEKAIARPPPQHSQFTFNTEIRDGKLVVDLEQGYIKCIESREGVTIHDGVLDGSTLVVGEVKKEEVILNYNRLHFADFRSVGGTTVAMYSWRKAGYPNRKPPTQEPEDSGEESVGLTQRNDALSKEEEELRAKMAELGLDPVTGLEDAGLEPSDLVLQDRQEAELALHKAQQELVVAQQERDEADDEDEEEAAGKKVELAQRKIKELKAQMK
jgi:hypothetical protein